MLNLNDQLMLQVNKLRNESAKQIAHNPYNNLDTPRLMIETHLTNSEALMRLETAVKKKTATP